MKYKTLGKSGIKVSEIGFGAWTIAMNWWGKDIQEDEAKRMLKKAYDVGINFFETGDMYGKGKSERLIGEVFKDMRDEIVISTKYGYDFENVDQIGHKELPQKFDPEFTDYSLKRSLERLQTDYASTRASRFASGSMVTAVGIAVMLGRTGGNDRPPQLAARHLRFG